MPDTVTITLDREEAVALQRRERLNDEDQHWGEAETRGINKIRATLNQQPADATETEEPVGEEARQSTDAARLRAEAEKWRITSDAHCSVLMRAEDVLLGRFKGLDVADQAEEVERLLTEFDAWLSFRGEFSEVLAAFRAAFRTDTSTASTQPESPSSSTEAQSQHSPPAYKSKPWPENPNDLAGKLKASFERHTSLADSSATTPPDGGLEERVKHLLAYDVQPFTMAQVEAAFATAISGGTSSDYLDAITDQSPETNPSPSQGEGSDVQ